MPRSPTDYSKTSIYKLVHKEDYDNQNIYIGTTTNFRKRKNEHKSRIQKIGNEHYNQQKYVFIRENGGWDMWDMIEIEKYSCNDKREAETRERYWIDYYKSNLNRYIPTRSMNEWHKDNKESRSLKCKEYNEKNREHLKLKKREYYENNKETHLLKSREYAQRNKEKTQEYQVNYRKVKSQELKEYKKQYYQENKERTLEKVKCECGMSVGKSHLSKHQKTAKHLQLLNGKS